MKIENIIKSLNNHITIKRLDIKSKATGKLILQKSIVPSSVIRACKIIDYNLWFIKDKEKFSVLHYEFTTKLTEDNKEKVIEEVETYFIEMIFNWIGSNYYSQVITDKYRGVNNI